MTYDPAVAKCDEKVFKQGRALLITPLSSGLMETWIEMVREDIKQLDPKAKVKIDWYYVGGRAVVKALGDVMAAYRSIKRMLPEHDMMQKRAHGARLYTGSIRELIEP